MHSWMRETQRDVSDLCSFAPTAQLETQGFQTSGLPPQCLSATSYYICSAYIAQSILSPSLSATDT